MLYIELRVETVHKIVRTQSILSTGHLEEKKETLKIVQVDSAFIRELLFRSLSKYAVRGEAFLMDF